MFDLILLVLLSNFIPLDSPNPSVCIIDPSNLIMDFEERDILMATIKGIYTWSNELYNYTNVTDGRWIFDIHYSKVMMDGCNVYIYYDLFYLESPKTAGYTQPLGKIKPIHISTQKIFGFERTENMTIIKARDRPIEEIQTIVTHEIGHVMGLDHDSIKNSVMNKDIRDGVGEIKKIHLKQLIRIYGENGFREGK